MKLIHQALWIKGPYDQSHNIIQLKEGPTFEYPDQPYKVWSYVDPRALKVYLNGKRLIGMLDIPGWVVQPRKAAEFDILNSGHCTQVTPGEIKILKELNASDLILVEQTVLAEDECEYE